MQPVYDTYEIGKRSPSHSKGAHFPNAFLLHFLRRPSVAFIFYSHTHIVCLVQMRKDGTRQHFDRIEIVRRANLPPLFSRNEGKMRMGVSRTHTHTHISPTRWVGAQNECSVRVLGESRRRGMKSHTIKPRVSNFSFEKAQTSCDLL